MPSHVNTSVTISIWQVWAWCAHSLTCWSSYPPPPPRRGFCPPFTAYPQMSRHLYHVRCCLLILPFHTVKKPSLSAFLSVMWSPLFLVHTSHTLSVCCDHFTPVMTAVVSTCQCVKMIVICTNNHSHNTVWSKASSVNLPFFFSKATPCFTLEQLHVFTCGCFHSRKEQGFCTLKSIHMAFINTVILHNISMSL